jgi:hypothetical protein
MNEENEKSIPQLIEDIYANNGFKAEDADDYDQVVNLEKEQHFNYLREKLKALRMFNITINSIAL